MEETALVDGSNIAELGLEEQEILWQKAKAQEQWKKE